VAVEAKANAGKADNGRENLQALYDRMAQDPNLSGPAIKFKQSSAPPPRDYRKTAAAPGYVNLSSTKPVLAPPSILKGQDAGGKSATKLAALISRYEGA
jgi:hypothetical protein